jgi:hypothetical protein
MELDDVLSDKEPEAKEPEAVEPAEPKEPKEAESVEKPTSRRKAHQAREFAAQGRDPATGQFVSKEPEKVEEPKKEEPKVAEPAKEPPPKEEMTEKERAFLKAAHEERTKRQALERQIEELRKAPQEPAKTFWDDPEGHLKAMQAQNQQAALQSKLQTAEMIARSRYQDFDAKMDAFKEMVQSMPGLAQQCFAAADPAEFAYKTAKTHLELREAGGLEQLRAKMEAEIRAKVDAEYKEKQEAEKAERARLAAALPPSLSDSKGVSQNRVTWGGPTPLDAIIGR